MPAIVEWNGKERATTPMGVPTGELVDSKRESIVLRYDGQEFELKRGAEYKLADDVAAAWLRHFGDLLVVKHQAPERRIEPVVVKENKPDGAIPPDTPASGAHRRSRR